MLLLRHFRRISSLSCVVCLILSVLATLNPPVSVEAMAALAQNCQTPIGAGLPLVTDALNPSKPPPSATSTIHGPPTALLSNQQECAMIIPIDRELNNVLLEIPNRLGWKFHFGCHLDKDTDARTEISNALLCAPEQLSLHKSGVMLFSFINHAPMRVHVYTANVPFDPHAGEYYEFDDVPYTKMWADDKIWMPSLLKEPDMYFEAHFCFDGPPGTDTKLLKHIYKVYD